MAGYQIIDFQKVEEHITFIRINPTNIRLTLREVFQSLSDLSWLSSFDNDYMRNSFQVRAEGTVNYIADNIIGQNESSVTSNSGEYVVSELARKAIVSQMEYLDIPLAELIKEKDAGNHGFDFYSKNLENILLFGEAKYSANTNAYGRAFEQIVRFENEERDSSDLIAIDRFCCDESKENFANGLKGYIAAFSSTTITTDTLVSNIKRNTDFISLNNFSEIICVAVNL